MHARCSRGAHFTSSAADREAPKNERQKQIEFEHKTEQKSVLILNFVPVSSSGEGAAARLVAAAAGGAEAPVMHF